MSTPASKTSAGVVPMPEFSSVGWRTADAFIRALARVGIGPMHLLTTRGRRTGQQHAVPVVPVEHGEDRWLVAPYGVVEWVKNVRADGHVELQHGRTRIRALAVEASAEEGAPVLKRYVEVATKVRNRFHATKDSPVEAFVDEVQAHPVFRLEELG